MVYNFIVELRRQKIIGSTRTTPRCIDNKALLNIIGGKGTISNINNIITIIIKIYSAVFLLNLFIFRNPAVMFILTRRVTGILLICLCCVLCAIQAKSVAHDNAVVAHRALTIYPGTKWCGNGHIAENYDDLGEHKGTDRCCRTHDHCKVIIPGLTSKYNYFNFRPYTIVSCSCDDR